MEPSILNSVKKLLGLTDDYTAFDMDIIVFINSTISSLVQLGVGSLGAFSLEDASANWEDLSLSNTELGLVKTYIFLKSKMLFDPPTTSFLQEVINKQITEHEWRLTNFRESNDDTYYDTVVPQESEVIW